jgi:hypothetical protein
MIMNTAAPPPGTGAPAGATMAAGGIFDLYRSKMNEINGLIGPTLALVGLIFVIVAYVSYRSWKKAIVAGVGAAIVIAVVAKIGSLSTMVKSEFQSAPANPRPAVTRPLDHPVDHPGAPPAEAVRTPRHTAAV